MQVWPCKHLIKMLVIAVHDTDAALAEQETFAVHVVFKALVLRGSDVIRLDVGKNTDLKRDTCGTVQHETLGGNLHDSHIAAVLQHPVEIFLDFHGFRRGVAGRDMSLTDDGLDGSDEAYLVARGFENGFDHVSSCCFSLGSGNTDDFQFLRRVIVPG